MPSTIVKLSSSDARAWAHNQPVWVNEAGQVARAVTREEQAVISRALIKTARMEQSFRQVFPLLPLQAAARRLGTPRRAAPSGPLPTIELAFDIAYYGKKRHVTVFCGELRYAAGREILTARLLADHGECVLHGRNGKCIGVLRDPFVKERPPNTGRRVQWSRSPEDIERAAKLEKGERIKAPRARPSTAQPNVYSPDHCPNDCRGRRGGGEWALAKGARPPSEREHHPVCKFAVAWSNTLEPSESASVLYDLELGVVARRAESEEVREAEEVAARTGMRHLTIGNRLFAVLPAAEAEAAAAEARGESAEAPLVPELAQSRESRGLARMAPRRAGAVVSRVQHGRPMPMASRLVPQPPNRSAPSELEPGAEGEGEGELAAVTAHVTPDAPPEDGSFEPAPFEERQSWPLLGEDAQPVERQSVDAREYLARKKPSDLPLAAGEPGT